MISVVHQHASAEFIDKELTMHFNMLNFELKVSNKEHI
jgi:hypothetical protein